MKTTYLPAFRVFGLATDDYEMCEPELYTDGVPTSPLTHIWGSLTPDPWDACFCGAYYHTAALRDAEA